MMAICSYEALQDIVYIQLQHGINFGISLKRSEITEMGCFWSTLDSKSQDPTKKISLAHHTSRITHHTTHIAYEFEIYK